MFARHGLDEARFDVLAALRRAGLPYQLSPGQLGALTLAPSGTVTSRVDRLEAAELVQRRDDPADGRGRLVRLTPTGRRTVDAALADLVAREAAILAGLSERQRATLAGLLRRLVAPFDEAVRRPASGSGRRRASTAAVGGPYAAVRWPRPTSVARRRTRVPGWRRTATWPTRAWPPPSSWPCALHRPLLLEGEAGVGKTEVAKVLSRWTGGELIRLQCYEGIDVAQAVYEWDYSRQLLHLRTAEAAGRANADAAEASRTSSTPSASSCAGRCCRPSTTARARRRCCSSTRSTGPTTSSRRSCSRSSPTTRSPSPSWARSGPTRRRS